VRIALDEKSLQAELVELDMRAGEHKSPAYLARNPYGRVPTLEHDEFVLFESTAILEYLEAIKPSPPLTPFDAEQRALAAMHMKLCDLEFGSQTRPLIFPARFLPKERWNLEAMNAARARVNAHLAILDTQLGDHEWLVGDAFSLVEVCYAPLVRFLDELELQAPPRVRAWSERVLARPSVRKNWLER
jgi:glutathione S-transferase